MSPEQFVKRYDVNYGYWIDCISAQSFDRGFWTSVWTNSKPMKILSNNLKNCTCSVANSNTKITIESVHHYYTETGSIVLYIDGIWINPKIKFDYFGKFTYTINGSKQYYQSAGDITIYTRTPEGSEDTRHAIFSINEYGTSINDYQDTIYGTFDRIGLVISFANYSDGINYDTAEATIGVKDLSINDINIYFPSQDFNFNTR